MPEKTPHPTPGRIVHYVLPTASKRCGQHRAAMVTSDFGPAVFANLNVYPDQDDDLPGCAVPGGVFRVWSCEYEETGTMPGTWHWPERTN